PSHYPNDRTQNHHCWKISIVLLGSSNLLSGTQTRSEQQLLGSENLPMALIDQFRIGLKNNMKDLLLTIEDPTSLNNAISKVVHYDNRLFEQHYEQQGYSLEWGNSVTNYSRSSLTPKPMQINSTRARTLSEEEKQR
ncbi:9412_t:CDS:2, partial [Dentiscutata heterogama]